MKLSKNVLDVLKNFSTINQGLYIRKGNVITVTNIMKSIVGKAVVDTDFPNEFAIYNINQFLDIYKLDTNADVDFQENVVLLSCGNQIVEYKYCDKDIISSVPDNFGIPDTDTKFSLSYESIKTIFNYSSSLMVEDINFVSDGTTILIVAKDNSNSGTNSFSMVLDQKTNHFNFTLKYSKIKVLPYDYEVNVNANSVHLINRENNIEYWIALD
jgi:hypothetical protein